MMNGWKKPVSVGTCTLVGFGGVAGLAFALQGAPSKTAPAVWTVDSVPVRKLVMPAPAPTSRVSHISDAGRLSSGELVVAMNGTLQTYDSAGALLRGTKTFRQSRMYISELSVLAGDTIAATGSDNLLRYFTANLDSVRAAFLQPLTEQSYLLSNGIRLGANPHIGARSGWGNPYDLYLLRTTRASTERVYLGTIAPPVSEVFGRTPFTARSTFTVARGRIVVGFGMEPLLRVFSNDGRRQTDIRLGRTTRKVSRSDIEAFWAVPSNNSDRTRFNRYASDVRDAAHGMHRPYYDRIAGDSDGNIWIEDYRVDRTLPAHWTVIDTSGIEIARIILPAGFSPTQIDRQYITGVDRTMGRSSAAYIYHVRR